MFEVRIIVEDSKLHKALWALDGLIVGQPQLLPVRNAVASKDKKQVKEKTPSKGGKQVELHSKLLSRGETNFSWEDAANIIESLGMSRTTTSAYLTRLIAEGKIKRVDKGKYEVK
jgi:hypothetical protein